MKTREEAVQQALTFPDVYRDEPFHDPNWIVIRKKQAFLVLGQVLCYTPVFDSLKKKKWLFP